MKIIESRLEGVPGNIVEPDAIQFASRKVAAVSGDCRRNLDICRRAVEIAEAESVAVDIEQITPIKKQKSTAPSPKRPEKRRGKVTINTIKQAIAEATSTPTQHFLRSLPPSSKLFLVALLARNKRSGVAESTLREVLNDAVRLLKVANADSTAKCLGTYPLSIGTNSIESDRSQASTAARIISMGTSAVTLAEAGVLSLETRKGERIARIRLCAAETDVQLALRGDLDLEWMRL